MVRDFMPAMCLIKLEKLCRGTYALCNEPCNACDHESLFLSPHCKSIWRTHYDQHGFPFMDKHPNVSCHVIKFFISKKLLEQFLPGVMSTLQRLVCGKDNHILM